MTLAVDDSITKSVVLQNQNGDDVNVQDLYQDSGVIFFMYPRANTSGCTVQARGFRDNIDAITSAGFAVYGLSDDQPDVLLSWKDQESLPYDLLSDPEHELISYFGSSVNDGKRVQRSHVVVLKGGVIGDIQSVVTPQESVERGVAFVINL